MTEPFSFRLIATDGAARRGEIATPHGTVRTPAFMPVGTQATVKGLSAARRCARTGADILLGNTYHLMLRPGAERIAALGGLHTFMNWPRADPDRFRRLPGDVARRSCARSTSDGVTFRSHHRRRHGRADAGARRSRSRRCSAPTSSMQLDECVELPAPRAELERAMQLSLRWAERCKRAFESAPAGRALFGIVQGGDDPALRAASARGADRYRLSTATPSAGSRSASRRTSCCKVVEETAPALPADRPRYLMGVGTPDDMLEAVARGIDMFDCVLPTRNGRHGAAFTRFGPINLEERAARRRSAAARRGEPVPGRARLFARLSASSGEGERDARRDAAVGDQSRLLPGADGGHARGDRRAPVRASSAPRRAEQLGAGRFRALR